MTTPFEGLQVLDLSDRLSGAFAARLFGDFGADVLLAEPPEGHALRLEPPFLAGKPGPDSGSLHAYANWNKRSVLIEPGGDLAVLIRNADVVITTADPLDDALYADHLPEMRSDAVHLSVTPHGLDDPLGGQPGNNLTASARTGWSWCNGYKDEAPLQLPRHQSGYVGGVTGFIAASAALRRRGSFDAAERVDVSELEAFALTLHTWAIGAIYADRGFSYGAAGGRPRGTHGPLWTLKDGRMNFGLADFHNWQEAMGVLGIPEIGEIPELIPDMGRHGKDLRPVSAAMVQSLPHLERWPVFHQLAELRCVIGVMQDVDDVLTNEQILAREFPTETTVEGQSVKAAGAPAKLSPSPWQHRSPAPGLGAHTEAIKAEAGVPETRRASHAVTDAPAPTDLARGPLAGVRVLSFGQAWSGTFATQLLAMLGADVVQIGSLHRPDVFRRMSGEVPAGVVDPGRRQHPLNTQGAYNSVNLHKREVTLDLRKEEGMELLWRLLPEFDILADNFRPTVIPGWGITLEKLHELRPGMIWASVSGYGATGPYGHYPANGATTEPMSGLSSIHGYEGDPGMNTGGLYPDPVSGYFLVATIMAALAHRDRTGEAQRIDLSMMEALNVVCGDAMIERGLTGRLPTPGGNHHPRVCPHNNYRAANDEWLALATESETAWQTLVADAGDPRLADSRFGTMALRKTHEAELDQVIGEWVQKQDAGELERRLGPKGVTVARVRPFYDIYNVPDPQFRESGFISQVDHPEVGPSWLPGRPWRYPHASQESLRHAPCVGQHSREVLVDELGLTASEYETLVAAGVTGTLDDVR